MMEKIIEAGSWDGPGMDTPATLVKVSSRGLVGNDRARFLKLASHEFLRHIDNIKIHPDEIPVHLTAIGATEGYGCFVAGTEVRRSDGALVAIEELREGESVIDRRGRPGTISTRFQRDFSGTGVRLSVAGLLDPIVCTDNHPFFIIKAAQVACLIDKEKHCKPGTCQINAICHERNCARAYPTYDSEKVAAREIEPGDYVLCPVPDRGTGQATWAWSDAMAAVFGYWLAEGSFVKSKQGRRKGLSFCFGLHELETVCRDFELAATALCDEYAGLRLAGPWIQEADGCVSYTLRGSDALAERFYRSGGEYAYHKRLQGPVYSQTPQKLARMLAAYFDGDGTCPEYQRLTGDYTEARYSATTASRRLALDIQWILSRLGVAACVQESAVSAKVEGSSDSQHYRVSFNNASGSFLAEHSRKYRDIPPEQYKEHSFLWNGFICRPVREAAHFELRAAVYNIEVLSDHSYTVGNGVACGNSNRNGDAFSEQTCRDHHSRFVKDSRWYTNHRNKDKSKSYGSVKLSMYNEPMRRIELLILGNAAESAAARNHGLVLKRATIEALERGDDVPFSMACLVDHDVCSNCHNKAAHRGEYCTEDTCVSPTGVRMFGCTHGLTKVARDGRQQFVENPNPRFFDISDVVRPADRIGFGSRADYLLKAAAAERVIGGAELAEYWAQRNGEPLSLVNMGDPLFGYKISRQRDLLPKLAEFERRLDVLGPDERDRALAGGFTSAVQPPFDVQILGEPGSEKMACAISAMQDYRVSLPPRDFLRWLIPDQTKQAHYLRLLQPRLPGVFTRLAGDPDLDIMLRTNPYTPTAGAAATTDLHCWAAKHAQDFSLDTERVRDRMTRSFLRGGCSLSRMQGGLSFDKRAEHSAEADELARQYALMKLAVLAGRNVALLSHQDELIEMAVRENYVV